MSVPVPSGLRIHSPALHALPSGASEDIQDLSSSSEAASSDSVQLSPPFSQSVSLPAEPSEILQGPNNLNQTDFPHDGIHQTVEPPHDANGTIIPSTAWLR